MESNNQKMRPGETITRRYMFLLPDLDSNQDKQNQNLLYYHYTIGQLFIKIQM